MTVLEAISMATVGIFGTMVVLVRDPVRQVIALGPFSIALVVLFTILQAPDVVLSAIVVGLFAYPVMVLLTLAQVRRRDEVARQAKACSAEASAHDGRAA